jgi:hypothetical protein
MQHGRPHYKVPEQAVAKRPEAAAPFLGAQEAAYKQEPLPATGGVV